MEQFFNRKRDKETTNHLHVGTNIRPPNTTTAPSDVLCGRVKDEAEARPPKNVLPEKSLHSFPHKKRKLEEELSIINSPGSNSTKVEEFNQKEAKLEEDKRVETCSKVIAVTERPGGVSI